MSYLKRRFPHWRFALFDIVLLSGVAAYCALPYMVPFDTLFLWSKPSLDSYARIVMAPGSKALLNPPNRVGCFNVLKTESLPHGFVIQHDSCNPFDWCGIAYSTEPLAEEIDDAKGDATQWVRPLGKLV